ncbi:MAG: type II toxin-antitoxin system RelB/DinJ family antitoxin [Candidatus Beckwithbacteria bacterium]
MQTAQYLQVRLDPQTKSQAESVLSQMGLTMTQAVKLYLRQIIMRKSIPFPIVIPAEKMPHATKEEELMIKKSLNQISQGDSITIDMKNTSQVKKHFDL